MDQGDDPRPVRSEELIEQPGRWVVAIRQRGLVKQSAPGNGGASLSAAGLPSGENLLLIFFYHCYEHPGNYLSRVSMA